MNTKMSRKEITNLFQEKCPVCRLQQCVCRRADVRALEADIEKAERETQELNAILDEKEKSMSMLRQSLMRTYSTTSSEPRRRRQRAILEDADSHPPPAPKSNYTHRKISDMSCISRDVAASRHREEHEKIEDMQARAKRLLSGIDEPGSSTDAGLDEEAKENVCAPRPDFSTFMKK
jgi:hypothetical protein